MEYIVVTIAVILGAIVSGALIWGISRLKEYYDLDPDGQIMTSFMVWEEHIVEWVIAETKRRGGDLRVPEFKYEVINDALNWAIPKIPKIMDFLGYSRDDLGREIESLVDHYLDELYEKLT